MVEQTLVKNCITCGTEFIEGKNIKENWHKPICNKCREVLLNYHLNEDRINRITRFRWKTIG